MSLKNYLNKVCKVIFDRDYRFWVLAWFGFMGHVKDETYLKRMYKLSMGIELDLDNPKRYTEKLQWLKLYDHKPQYSTMVDKYEVKKFVADRIGKDHVIPSYGVWNNFDEIDFESLPSQFVLKCTHDSGTYVICTDKNNFDMASAKKLLEGRLKRNFYAINREWPYKNVKPRIIAEAYMEDKKQGELRDYKFFTFNGEPKVVYIAQGRGSKEETVADFFDMNMNHLDLMIDHEKDEIPPELPNKFEQMKLFAGVLSKGTPQLRVDFYEVNGHVYFGELTFFHCSGLVSFKPDKWDYTFGEWLVLPEKNV